MTDTQISNDSVFRSTGKGWDEWFNILDKWGASDKGHKATALWLLEKHKLKPWWSQMVAVKYERSRGLREVNERAKGFGTSVQRTIITNMEAAWKAWADPSEISKWFTFNASHDFREGGRYSNGDKDAGEYKRILLHKMIRFTWEQPQHAPGSVVEVTFEAKDKNKVVVRLQHERIGTNADSDNLHEGWSWAMDSLKSYLETGRKITWDEWKKGKEESEKVGK